MNLRHIIGFRRALLLCLCLLAGINASASYFEVGGICYRVDYYDWGAYYGDEACVCERYGGYSGSVVIPEKVTFEYYVWNNGHNERRVKTCRVTSIGSDAFFGCTELTSVTIPNSVTDILPMAFWECTGLTSITIPDGVTYIGTNAFAYCSNLASISIPESVTRVGMGAFADTAWENSQPDGLMYIGKVAYIYKGDMPENTHIEIKEGTVRIEDYAFYVNSRANLTSITIPESVTSIGEWAFNGCSGLMSIAVPDKVNSIEYDAFSGTAWYDSQPNGLVYAGKVVYDYKGDMPLFTHIEILQGTLGIADGAFSSCSGMTSVTIPNSVTIIGREAFSGCSGLTSVIIPESVTKLDSLAFRGCSFLENSFINNSAQMEVGCGWGANIIDEEMADGLLIIEDAVAGCRPWATSVTIPRTVTGILNFYNRSHDRIFSYCKDLKEIYCLAEETPEVYGHTSWGIDVSKILLVVPDDAVDKYKAHSAWGQFMIETPTDISLTPAPSPVREGNWYDLNGRKIVNGKLSKDINIIRMSDGTTRKVLIK